MSRKRAVRAVLFDFDYTRVDATEGNLECLNAGLAAVGVPSVPYELAEPHLERFLRKLSVSQPVFGR